MTLNSFLSEPINLLKEHYDIYVVVNLEQGESLCKSYEFVNVHSIKIYRKINLLADLQALLRLFVFFRQHKFQLVHSVTPKAGLLAMSAAFLAGIKVRLHTFTGQVWVTKKGLVRWILKSIDRLIGKLTTDALVDSPSQRQFLLDEKILDANHSQVLGEGSISGVDTFRFKPDELARKRIRAQLNFTDSDVVFLFLGRLNHDKGLLDLASAYSMLENKFAKLLIVGPDEANLTDQIKVITRQKSDSIRFVKFCLNPEEYMAASDVVCLPSYREGFGNVIIEAAAVGIPAIGTRIYGLSDAIEDGHSGLLFNPKDISELANCMKLLLDDENLRLNFGAQAKQRVVDRFSSQVLTRAWLVYYQDKL